MQAHHELGMKAQEEIMKRQEEAADKQLSRHDKEKAAIKDIADMKDKMAGQDINQQNVMLNQLQQKQAGQVGVIKARLAMNPEDRRQADRDARKDEALDRKAKRIFEGKQREAERKAIREAKLGDRVMPAKQVAPAAPKAADPADVMKNAANGFKQAVDDLVKLRVVAILNT